MVITEKMVVIKQNVLDETIPLTRSMSIIAKMRKLGSMQHSFGNSQALHDALDTFEAHLKGTEEFTFGNEHMSTRTTEE